MNSTNIFNRLYENAGVFKTLMHGVSDDQAKWKPAGNKWSLLEVVNHLYDEERDDFRLRLDLILHHPEKDWPPIDPEGWVIERKYNQSDLGVSLNNFIAERRKSVEWLKNIAQPQWKNICVHPKIGEIRAGDMLAAWLAHDFLHMRQIVNVHLEYHNQKAKPFSIK